MNQSNSSCENEDEEYFLLPEFVSNLIPYDEWRMWQKSYRDLFLQMFFHPNVYFYTERPPYEIYNEDSNFTEFEQRQFISRQQYFLKNYGRVFSLFGFFAIPFVGRTGFKLSNFYKQYIKLGFLKDDTVELLDDDIINFKGSPLTNDQLEMLKQQSFLEMVPIINKMKNLMKVQPIIPAEFQDSHGEVAIRIIDNAQ